MSDNYSGKKYVTAGLGAAAAFSALFIILGFLPENPWWGINHLAYYPLYARLIFIALIILAFLPPVRKLFGATLGRLSAVPAKAAIPTALIASALFFILFRIRVHSLGDSYLRANEITGGRWYQPTELLDFLVHAALYHFLNLIAEVDAITAIAAASVAAGVVFVFLLFRMTPYSGWKKNLLVTAVLSLGCSQLFFGYVESYTLLYLFAVWYLFLVFRKDKYQVNFGLLTLVYLLAGLSHQVGMILLLPSYLYLAHQRYKTHVAKALILPSVLLVSFLPFLITRFINRVSGFEEYRELTAYFLPLVDETYGVLTPLHLFDILNQFLLAAPVMVMLLPFMPYAVRSGQRRLAALLLIIPSFLFIFLFNPELTMVRDWDLFSLPVATAAIPFLILVFDGLPEKSQAVAERLTGVALVAIIILASWVLLNNYTSGHLKRAEHVIDTAVKGQRYGYENLAHYFDGQRDYENELRVLMKIKPRDRTPRVYGELAQMFLALGRLDEAYEYAQRGVRMPRPRRINAFMAGVTAYDKGKYLEAIHCFRGVMTVDQDDFQVLWRLGESLVRVDSLDEAIAVYNHALALDRSKAFSCFGLAGAYYRKGAYDRAEKFCREGLRLNPDAPEGKALLESIQNKKQ